MSVGQLFMILATVLFFLAGVGVQALPNILIWGWFCLSLGIVTSGIPLWRAS
jgi:hypothetical protein